MFKKPFSFIKSAYQYATSIPSKAIEYLTKPLFSRPEDEPREIVIDIPPEVVEEPEEPPYNIGDIIYSESRRVRELRRRAKKRAKESEKIRRERFREVIREKRKEAIEKAVEKVKRRERRRERRRRRTLLPDGYKYRDVLSLDLTKEKNLEALDTLEVKRLTPFGDISDLLYEDEIIPMSTYVITTIIDPYDESGNLKSVDEVTIPGEITIHVGKRGQRLYENFAEAKSGLRTYFINRSKYLKEKVKNLIRSHATKESRPQKAIEEELRTNIIKNKKYKAYTKELSKLSKDRKDMERIDSSDTSRKGYDSTKRRSNDVLISDTNTIRAGILSVKYNVNVHVFNKSEYISDGFDTYQYGVFAINIKRFNLTSKIRNTLYGYWEYEYKDLLYHENGKSICYEEDMNFNVEFNNDCFITCLGKNNVLLEILEYKDEIMPQDYAKIIMMSGINFLERECFKLCDFKVICQCFADHFRIKHLIIMLHTRNERKNGEVKAVRSNYYAEIEDGKSYRVEEMKLHVYRMAGHMFNVNNSRALEFLKHLNQSLVEGKLKKRPEVIEDNYNSAYREGRDYMGKSSVIERYIRLLSQNPLSIVKQITIESEREDKKKESEEESDDEEPKPKKTRSFQNIYMTYDECSLEMISGKNLVSGYKMNIIKLISELVIVEEGSKLCIINLICHKFYNNLLPTIEFELQKCPQVVDYSKGPTGSNASYGYFIFRMGKVSVKVMPRDTNLNMFKGYTIEKLMTMMNIDGEPNATNYKKVCTKFIELDKDNDSKYDRVADPFNYYTDSSRSLANIRLNGMALISEQISGFTQLYMQFGDMYGYIYSCSQDYKSNKIGEILRLVEDDGSNPDITAFIKLNKSNKESNINLKEILESNSLCVIDANSLYPSAAYLCKNLPSSNKPVIIPKDRLWNGTSEDYKKGSNKKSFIRRDDIYCMLTVKIKYLTRPNGPCTPTFRRGCDDQKYSYEGDYGNYDSIMIRYLLENYDVSIESLFGICFERKGSEMCKYFKDLFKCRLRAKKHSEAMSLAEKSCSNGLIGKLSSKLYPIRSTYKRSDKNTRLDKMKNHMLKGTPYSYLMMRMYRLKAKKKDMKEYYKFLSTSGTLTKYGYAGCCISTNDGVRSIEDLTSMNVDNEADMSWKKYRNAKYGLTYRKGASCNSNNRSNAISSISGDWNKKMEFIKCCDEILNLVSNSNDVENFKTSNADRLNQTYEIGDDGEKSRFARIDLSPKKLLHSNYCHISSCILSKSRCMMLDAYRMFSKVYYSDTDSIHANTSEIQNVKDNTNLIGEGMGQFKMDIKCDLKPILDIGHVSIYTFYVAKKVYCHIVPGYDNEGKLRIVPVMKAAGVTNPMLNMYSNKTLVKDATLECLENINVDDYINENGEFVIQ